MTASGKTSSGTFRLIGPDGRPCISPVPGTLGGHRGGKRYGRLDCRAALQAIARGGYVKHRVFFADEAAAIAAGYRPCAVCMPREYAAWKKFTPPPRSGPPPK
ncbi:MAG: Ada metal-binding domain-containing protein [Castellaniella sp.]|uniref:Ada metal-binding domain-containing protein n=1 Tax=Castellaniella hirudinis TaxID=1144617 RepID=A0ABV8S2K0_9BURK